MKFTANFAIKDLLEADNIAEMLSKEDQDSIGRNAVEDYLLDKNSRFDWEKRMDEAMKLALQVVEAKSFPWPNASNVKFPLVTIAALQYHARSYPVLVSSPIVVRCRVAGEDKTGELESKAKRVETHMSYQILEEDSDWEDQQDRVLITQPIIGCAFKKTYYDSLKGHNVSENILAKDLVVSYYTKSLETASRITHCLQLTQNDIYERVAAGQYLDVDLFSPKTVSSDTLSLSKDKAQGTTEPTNDPSKPFDIIEQHLLLDLDGDGYEEPYIAVVDINSKTLLRLVARFFYPNITYGKNDKILRIKGENYFTKYPFIPSPDGGFYDIGFGVLLGPLNSSINTLINQLIDAGTMSVTGGGFLSRGIKLRGGTQSFQPNEWKTVDSTGDDLRKGIMPLPVREPNQVLFTLLSLLINYGERIGGAVDILVGQNPGQNTPAETTRTMAEQGMKIFSGIFKRTYRSMKEEFRKLYRLNQLYMPKKVRIGTLVITAEDYNGDPRDISPAADPNMISESQRIHQATQLLQIANPAIGYNMYEVHKKFLDAMKISDMDKILPDPKGPNAMPPFVPPKIQEIKLKEDTKLKEIQAKAMIEVHKLEQDAEINKAKIIELEAKAMLELEQADGVQAGHQIAQFNQMLGIMKLEQDNKHHQINTLKEILIATQPDPTPTQTQQVTKQ